MSMLLRLSVAASLVAIDLPGQQGGWALVPGDPGPSAWTQEQMTFDRARGRAILVNNDRIWEAAGTTWRRVAIGPGFGGFDGAFAYDRVRNVSIWFGGYVNGSYSNATFTWDGVDWTQLPTANAPSPRITQMAYDVARDRMVLYGGFSPTGTFADTWEFDGTDWQERFPATSPSLVANVRMVYDIARAETVVYGNDLGVGQTWLYDGTDWRQATVSTPYVIQPAMIYDEARERTVLAANNPLTGTIMTWEWDGANWVDVDPNGPELRHSVTGAYDSVRGFPIIVGRSPDASTGSWRWDGTTWRSMTPFGAQPIRPGVAAAYHLNSSSIVAFGGSVPFFAAASSDTHVYDGAVWQRLAPANAPSPRSDAAMAIEPFGDVLLFGGRGPGSLGDTWRWDGNDWTQLNPANSPSPRFGHRMTTEFANARIVMFGGQDDAGTLLAETWEWSGNDWTRHTPATNPPGRVNQAMTFDILRNVTVMFGGGSTTTPILGDHWEWDGNDWTQRTPNPVPPARANGQMTYDPRGGVAVLVGGYTQTFPAFNPTVADTWTWDGTTWTEINNGTPVYRNEAFAVYDWGLRSTIYASNGIDHEFAFESTASVLDYGVGCPGASGPLEIDAVSVPRIGNERFAIWLSNTLSNAVALVGFDTAPAAIPLRGGCEGLLPTPFIVGAPTDIAGNALVPVPIPNEPSLRGLSLYCQAIAADPDGGLGDAASLSAGLAIMISS